uniref:Uncharacterized protein n=1 Tax=Polynucleobacter necessarius subsp. necessarius (strain STIR1) TaxID=452638 RepID=B1XTG5_POLNS
MGTKFAAIAGEINRASKFWNKPLKPAVWTEFDVLEAIEGAPYQIRKQSQPADLRFLMQLEPLLKC